VSLGRCDTRVKNWFCLRFGKRKWANRFRH
jgi:hypothetical protein